MFIPARNSRNSAPILPNSAAGVIFAPTEQPTGTPVVVHYVESNVGIEEVRPGRPLLDPRTTLIMATAAPAPSPMAAAAGPPPPARR